MPSSGRSRNLSRACWIICAATTIGLPHAAWSKDPRSDLTPSINDFGGTGLLQMPNARFQADGEFNLGASLVAPYTRGYLTLQGLPWLEGTFRYTDIRTRLFSSRPEFSGDQTFKDRAVDVKFRLLEETSAFPQIALGLRDIGGTTLFGSEFLVASRRYYNWDFTFGMAWGNAGTRGHLPNPFGFLSDRFKKRSGRAGPGGIAFGFFQGDRVSLFGGVEYLTPLDGLRLKLEYDGNDYKNEPTNRGVDSSLPINFGAEYDLYPWFRISAGLERGNQFMLRVGVHANLNTDKGPPKNDRPPPPVSPRKSKAEKSDADAEAKAPVFVGVTAAPLVRTASDTDGHAVADSQMFKKLERLEFEISDIAFGGREAVADGYTVSNDRLFRKLERLGFEVSGIAFDGGEAIVDIPVKGPQPTDGSLAKAAIEIGRMGRTGLVETVTFRAILDGVDVSRTSFKLADLRRSKELTGSAIALVKPPDPEWAVAFRDFDPNRRVADAIFDTLEHAGLSVGEFSLDGSRATIVLEDKAALPSDEALTQLSRTIGENVRGVVGIELVTFVAENTGAEEVRRTFEVPDRARRETRLAGSTEIQLAGGNDELGIENTGRPAWTGADRTDASETVLQRFAAMVFAELVEYGFLGERVDIDGRRAILYFSQDKYRNPAKAIGRAGRIVARHAPLYVEEIRLVLTELGIPVLRTTVLRKDLERSLTYTGSPEEIWHSAIIDGAPLPGPREGIVNDARYPLYSWSITPRLRQHVGGPDSFYFYQVWLQGAAGVELGPGLSLSGSVGVNLFNNFDGLTLESNSVLPHVRSDIKDYLQEGEQWIGTLHADYMTKFGPEWYGRLSAGLFELMFGGVGGEVLYRPVGKRWAAGLDFNYVRQRDFDGRLGFQDYDVATGHFNYYHKLPYYDILAAVHAGRYLAKDVGVTVELSRTFGSGVTFGVFATKTNISAEEFGEGQFDKGFFVSVPTDLFFASPTRRRASLTFRPLSRDGGQLLTIPRPLYWVTDGSDASAVGRGWAEFLE